MKDDPRSRYTPVREALPPVLPPISRQEARKLVVAIYRRFGGMKDYEAAFGYRPRKLIAPKEMRRVWISREPTTGHHKGIGRLVHDVSHRIFRRRHPTLRPHHSLHSVLEHEIAVFVASKL